MEIRKQKGKQVGRLTVTEQIDQKYQEDLQRLRGFLLLDDVHKNFVAKAAAKPYNVDRKVCGMQKEPY